MGKLFAGVGLVGIIGASVFSGMLLLAYFEGVLPPETCHELTDQLHDAIRGEEA